MSSIYTSTSTPWRDGQPLPSINVDVDVLRRKRDHGCLPFTQDFQIDAQLLTGTAARAKSPETSTKHVKCGNGTSQPRKQDTFSEFPFVPGIFKWDEPKESCSMVNNPYHPQSKNDKMLSFLLFEICFLWICFQRYAEEISRGGTRT